MYLSLFEKSSFKPNLPLPLFRGEGKGKDPFLELCAGLKPYLNSLTGKQGPGTDPQCVHVPSLQSSRGTSAQSKPGHLPFFGDASRNSSLKLSRTIGSISNPFTFDLPEFKQHWAMQWRYSPKFMLFQKRPQWTDDQECNDITILLKLLKTK